MNEKERVVVGYDGSDAAGKAVQWAAMQAHRSGCLLNVVHCSLWPVITHNMGPVPGIAGSGLRHAAESIVSDGVALAREVSADTQIATSLVYGWPAENLRKLAATASLLVVGTRGAQGFSGLLIGSVSLELASTAACPVAVVGGSERPHGPVVVGVADEGWEATLRYAANFASLVHAVLKIVHVHRHHAFHHDAFYEAGVAEKRALLDSASRSVRNTWPGLEVQDHLLQGTSVAGALVGAAGDAQVVVVGSSAQGTLSGSFGSTAHAVLHHAGCPVIVVRHPPA
ncbi:universal stress protein [Paenarthrobacter nitroguajacolicus]|uniref:universal stress protein n=1 Tax=Paenarthrobacter nitroguajacolicus TaxID=211146 RepID=UPI0028588043|nr:universal stress protein [Paenarthrobacter nitroguajacolicus]MDR6636884.1 nucleotide-binding universal stress UspA family protein [Paenarthrobacter nitroguajacolicus]